MLNIKEDETYYQSAEAKGFLKLTTYANGGVVLRHHLVNTNNSDYPTVESIAYLKASEGSEVLILPELFRASYLRREIFSNAKEGKCPDLQIDKVFVEVKSPKAPLTQNNISTNIRRGHEQANHVIIDLSTPFDGDLEKIAKGRFNTHAELKVIEFRVFKHFVKYLR